MYSILLCKKLSVERIRISLVEILYMVLCHGGVAAGIPGARAGD